MKDELHVYCMLEGIDEVYLRARTTADKKLLRLEKKRKKNKERYVQESQSLECIAEPNEG